jgi:AcrR family transcriptional regulator
MYTKTDIVNIAGKLFSERGYHGTSMRDLAKVLAVRGATLYSHVESKEEMLWEIVNRAADEFLAAAAAVPQDSAPEERLKLLVRGHLDVIARELPYATVFFHEWQFLEPSLREQIKERRDAYEQHFRQVIEDGIKQGCFQVEDARVATLFVLSALNWTYQWFRPDGLLTIEQLAEQYNALILRSLKAGI